MTPLLCERNRRWLLSHRGHDPPPSRSSTRGLNDARFRGRWAGRPRSFETGQNHPRPRDSTPLPSLPIPPPPICLCQPREEFEECRLSATPSHCHTDLEAQKWKGSAEVIVEAVFGPDHGCLADKQAAVLGSATLNGTLNWSCCHFRLWASGDRMLLCMPCVNILPETVEWSHVMQVKYNLQAVVNNCDIICTLNFSSYWQLVNLLWYLLQWLTGFISPNSVAVMCNLFALKCVDMKHEQDNGL